MNECCCLVKDCLPNGKESRSGFIVSVSSSSRKWEATVGTEKVEKRESGDASPDILDRFKQVQTSVVCDAMGRLGLSGFMDEVRPFRIDMKMAGRARTLRYGPRRNASLPEINPYAFIYSLKKDDVLLFGADRTESWVLGENVAHAVMYQGAAGLITDGRARDSKELSELGFPVFARGAATRPPSSIEIVAADAPINCGGAQVNPGDIVAGDADGVVVVPASHANEVLHQIGDIEGIEKELERAIRDRMPPTTLLALLKRKSTVKK